MSNADKLDMTVRSGKKVRRNGKWSMEDKRAYAQSSAANGLIYIVPDHVGVSKCHALMPFRQGNYYLTDNYSTNKTVINEHILKGSTVLHEKDVISIPLNDTENAVRRVMRVMLCPIRRS